jgi:hypothetical protein
LRGERRASFRVCAHIGLKDVVETVAEREADITARSITQNWIRPTK